MSNYPTSYDDDASLPPVNDNLTEIGGDVINAARDAIFQLEIELGLGASGSTGSVAARLGVALNNDGTLKASALTGLGLVTLPITNSQVSSTAAILESKLKLDYSTQNLYNYIADLSSGVNSAIGWIATTGIKLDPHIYGAIYRHVLSHIDVSGNSDELFKNKFNLLRDNANAYTALRSLNDELVTHQQLDGSPSVALSNVPLLGGGTIPSYYAHAAGGIHLNSSPFTVIPQSIIDVQSLAEFIDSAGIFLYGSRIQNLYSNGIPRASRSSSLVTDGYGDWVCEEVSAISYLLDGGLSSAPFDDIDNGDDMVELVPSSELLSGHAFDSQFAKVKPGDILRINYGGLQTSFVIKEKKYVPDDGKKFFVRIAGKNLVYSTNAKARIDRPLFNNNKFGVLAVAPANNVFGEMPSLIVGTARGAMALGNGFNADHIGTQSYMLYLMFYPTGNPADESIQMPGIDISGDAGTKAGSYTLDSVVYNVNQAFRKNGYNYRFIAYSYKGEFGIMLADSINNASFSVVSAIVDSSGNYDSVATTSQFPKNIVNMFITDTLIPDPLGFSPLSGGVATPLWNASYGSAAAAIIPTKIFRPLKRNNYYVNGIEKEKLALDIGQTPDKYGDGYWVGEISAQQVFPANRVETTYTIKQDLSASGIKAGKTLVVEKLDVGTKVDFGRFIIKGINFGCDISNPFTQITVYDAVHANGSSPSSSVLEPVVPNQKVAIYFGTDSVSFNAQSSTDLVEGIPSYKRHFEVYVDANAYTFTHERARIHFGESNKTVNGVTLYSSSEISKLNIVKVSPKLRGYQFGTVTKITLHINSFDSVSGEFIGYLCKYDGTTYTHVGPTVTGKQGQKIRFYDETHVDYIDIKFELNDVITFTNKNIDFQLFSTLSLDDEIMLLSTCQVSDLTKTVSHLVDHRQFGNIAEKEFSTSALDFLSAPERFLHSNGVIRGFDFVSKSDSVIELTGGSSLVNGKLVQMNNETVIVPLVKEIYNSVVYQVNWAICVNEHGEYQPIPLLDYDYNLGTPNAPTRLFKAINFVNSLQYDLDATTFSNLVNNRKDLTVLYIFATNYNSTPSLTLGGTIIDCRKFVHDNDSILPLTFTKDHSHGNFKNATSILTWLKYNYKNNGTAVISGIDSPNNIVTQTFNFNFDSDVEIDGKNNGKLVFNAPVIFGSRVTFKNMDIEINAGMTVASSTSKLSFINCNILYTQPDGTIIANYPTDLLTSKKIFEFSGSSDINFLNSNFIANFYPTLEGVTVFHFTGCEKFYSDFSNYEFDFDSNPSMTNPGNMFYLNNCDDFTFKNGSCEALCVSAIKVDGTGAAGSENIVIDNFNMTTNFTPEVNSDDLVEASAALVHVETGRDIDNFIVKNCKFTGNVDRYGYLTFLLKNNNLTDENRFPTLSRIIIEDNNFFTSESSLISSNIDDYRSAIAFVNMSVSIIHDTLDFNNPMPLLINSSIKNNKCNSNQSIVLTSFAQEGRMVYPGLAVSSVDVSKNTCGSIGYWVTSNETNSSDPAFNLKHTSRDGNIMIEKNVCKYIGNMDSTGKYFPVHDDNDPFCLYPSGYVTIKDNVASWIITALFSDGGAGLLIDNNHLTAYTEDFLETINAVDAIDVPLNYAIFIDGPQANSYGDV